MDICPAKTPMEAIGHRSRYARVAAVRNTAPRCPGARATTRRCPRSRHRGIVSDDRADSVHPVVPETAPLITTLVVEYPARRCTPVKPAHCRVGGDLAIYRIDAVDLKGHRPGPVVELQVVLDATRDGTVCERRDAHQPVGSGWPRSTENDCAFLPASDRAVHAVIEDPRSEKPLHSVPGSPRSQSHSSPSGSTPRSW